MGTSRLLLLAIAAIVSSGNYVQFNNEIGLHLQAQQAETPWRAMYTQASSEVVTMDLDGRGGFSFLDSSATAAVNAIVAPRCNQFPVVEGPCSIHVLFAVSKCLDTSTILVFSQWMQKLAAAERKFLTGGRACNVTFSTVLLAACTEAPRTATSSSSLSTTELASYFTPFGNVYCSMAELGLNTTVPPAAVVSLFSDKISHDVVVAYEEERSVHTVFNFYVCPVGAVATKCQAAHKSFADDSTFLAQDADLFVHSPFKAVQSFHCANALPKGLPVVYVDPAGARQCFCKCPSGYEESTVNEKRVCVPAPKETCACYWSGRKYAFDITTASDGRSAANTCRISNLYPQTINRIPYPRSNYVAQARTNDGDTNAVNVTDGSPLIQVSVTQVSGGSNELSYPVETTKRFAWSYFVQHREAIANDISLTGPGIYAIKMTAKGYRSAADCEVCVAVVDKFRPVSSSQCPKPFCDQDSCLDSTAVLKSQPVAEYTPKNIAAAQALIDAHVAYAADKNVVNDVCGGSSGGRCDDKRFTRRNMFDAAYAEVASFDSGRTCFTDKVKPDIVAKLQESPFGGDLGLLNVAVPVPAGQCTRCCKFETKLKEFWHNYQCGNSTPPAKVCGGSDPGCVTEQCLVGRGSTFFTASATVKAEYEVTTKELIANVFPTKGYQSETEIHLQLECSAFGRSDQGKCGHIAPLHDLFAVSSNLNDRSILVDEKQYVYWRFRVDGGDWRSFDDKVAVRFYGEHAVVALEAWSQCGIVKTFVFHVYQHLNQPISVNDDFDGMWYQSSSSLDSTTGGGLCNYAQSDFAELTFDFQPLAGLVVNQTQTLPWVSTGVACDVQYADTRLPVPLFASTARNATVLRRFSFQMQSLPTTRADTTFSVLCKFSYASTYTNRTVTLPATKTFTIKNCDKPDWDCPFGECSDKCAAAGAPAPFSICGGRSVSTSASSETVVTFQRKACCATCGPAECQSVFGRSVVLRDEEDVLQCVVSEGAKSNYTTELLELQAHEDMTTSVSTAVVACVFLVLGVLLVVWGRRQVNTHCDDGSDMEGDLFVDYTMNGGYYPLLDRQ
ncbi:hypothetical protein H257_00486 [Aphanomyces astaci]|uniref:Uncharacterized protein n=1 Tax=Aphanomyces astaci TaxID=112090 RepID=W4HCV7_APHAT|nr:hypothetical protein H257_00486 [Aphanomyces astaci]ETV89109.1 hypothetical protein H257_00486 [Aphanomyces astaci]|eukprot:XP_009821509.1 hypothetical protein H257_00486 [Aphanomyces astaci]